MHTCTFLISRSIVWPCKGKCLYLFSRLDPQLELEVKQTLKNTHSGGEESRARERERERDSYIKLYFSNISVSFSLVLSHFLISKSVCSDRLNAMRVSIMQTHLQCRERIKTNRKHSRGWSLEPFVGCLPTFSNRLVFVVPLPQLSNF